ncbi:YbjN domain-containing protein [Actinoplanes sp. NPDC051633]|uniref:YbjN domain-containing protein n=1 Tax=Actinoplanes sp. NPDC051633 TaxID=3155670 RepID=UPI00343F756C
MPWWSWRPGSAGGGERETGGEVALQSSVRVGVPAQREPGQSGHSGVPAELPKADEPDRVAQVTLARIGKALDLLDIRFLADGGGSLLAMWERHAVLFTLEGPDDEILVMRARPHSTVPPDWADRAYRVVNEWNHTRRFCKAYVGDPTERGQLPIYAELQVPLNSGAHDALLVEMLDCGAAVATSFVDWLHDEGALL